MTGETHELSLLRERIIAIVVPAAMGNGFNSDQAIAFSKEVELFILSGDLAPRPKALFEIQMKGLKQVRSA